MNVDRKRTKHKGSVGKVGNWMFLHMSVTREWDKLVQFSQHGAETALPAVAATKSTQQGLRDDGVLPFSLSHNTLYSAFCTKPLLHLVLCLSNVGGVRGSALLLLLHYLSFSWLSSTAMSVEDGDSQTEMPTLEPAGDTSPPSDTDWWSERLLVWPAPQTRT